MSKTNNFLIPTLAKVGAEMRRWQIRLGFLCHGLKRTASIYFRKGTTCPDTSGETFAAKLSLISARASEVYKYLNENRHNIFNVASLNHILST